MNVLIGILNGIQFSVQSITATATHMFSDSECKVGGLVACSYRL